MSRTSPFILGVLLCMSCGDTQMSGVADTGAPDAEGGATDSGRVGDASAPVPSACSAADRFRAEDVGPVIRWGDVPGLSEGATIADNTSYLTTAGQVRLYFWANQGMDMANGVRSALADDGVSFGLEDGLRIAGPYGHPKLVELEGGAIRMFHLIPGGIGSSFSEDGLLFTIEGGSRLSNDDAGLERVGGISVIPLPGGGYRAYFSDLGIPGVPPSGTELKSASSPDTLSWTMDDGVRIGEGAPHLTGWSRQPFALDRGEGCVTLFYQQISSPPTSIHYATSTDGLEFTEEHALDLRGYAGPQAGANVQVLADGSFMLYYDAMDASEGNHIRAARLFAVD